MGVTERKAREKARRRQEILDAAKKVFTAKGFAGATMEEIAQGAELSPGTLYLYFRNKIELYASLNITMLEHLVSRVEALRDQDGLTPFEKVRGLAGAMYGVYRFDPLILTNVVHMQSSENLKSLSPGMQQEINGLAARALRGLGEIFQEGIVQGEFREYHPIALGDIVWAVFTGLVLWEDSKRVFDPGKDYLKPTLELAMEVMARGLSKN